MNAKIAQFIISVALTGSLCESAWANEESPKIEVFTDSTVQIVSGADKPTVYVIDRIHQLQQELSADLPTNPKTAKQMALQRFQQMDGTLSSELENASTGLVKALQYGIDRYPAIVFDGAAVVYGVSDINAAARFYRHWRAEGGLQ